jgi:hypothetical protein
MNPRRVTPVLFVLLPTIAFASSAAAQSTQARATGSRWEIEVHGGGAHDGTPTDGTSSLPPAGEAFTTSSNRQSRRTSSWYFGDGASLINEINASFPVGIAPGRITPLDPVLSHSGATRMSGGNFGFRVAYRITSRLTPEFTLDAAQGTLKLTDALLAGVEVTRASFIEAWNNQTGLIRTGGGVVFTNSNVLSTAIINDEQGRQLFTTGALNINLIPDGRLIPYATIGAGVVSNMGDAPNVTLVGNYRFTSTVNNLGTGSFPVNETDTVTIRLAPINKRALVTVFGGGVKVMGSSRWGVRGDVRAYISKNTFDVLIDADPQVVTSTPAGTVSSALTPSIQFSNNPSTGRPSNLSGSAISGFKAFSSSGTPVQVNVSGGLFFRF